MAYNKRTDLQKQLSDSDFNFTGFHEIKDNEKGEEYSAGIFIHPEIAFEFANWLSVAVHLRTL